MGTKYTYRCPKQSYAISLQMCLARQIGGDHRCRHCKARPVGDEAPDVAGGLTAVAATAGRVAA